MKYRQKVLRISVVLLVALLVALAVAYACPEQVLTVDSGAVRAQVMVVLGGAPTERPQRAAELFKAGEAPLVICSGFGDAELSRAVLLKAGVPAVDILLEPDSRTTQENAKFTIALLRARHLTNAIIVTSWYHSRRARACFEHYAPEIQFYSRPDYVGYRADDPHRRYVANYLRSEYRKILGYWVRYGVCPW
ncbi:MAG: YdcF family protein [Verrucomicrobiota bacterium]